MMSSLEAKMGVQKGQKNEVSVSERTPRNLLRFHTAFKQRSLLIDQVWCTERYNRIYLAVWSRSLYQLQEDIAGTSPLGLTHSAQSNSG